MSIVGGLDIHRSQITFDVLDTVTGEAVRGQVRPADREHLGPGWRGFDGLAGDLAMEGCTGWRYVAEEAVAAAGLRPRLADPAEQRGQRGRRRHAKTDRADARFMREQLQAGRLPECWVPPPHVLEYRALLEAYHDLRADHTAWVQRIHAALFHQGAPRLGGDLGSRAGQARLAAVAAGLSPAGQAQVAVALEVTQSAGRAAGGTAPPAGFRRPAPGGSPGNCRPASTASGRSPPWHWPAGWAGRGGSPPRARRSGSPDLDVTVYSSAGRAVPRAPVAPGPGRAAAGAFMAERQDPRPHLSPRPCLLRAGRGRIDGKRAALSEAREIVRQVVHILAKLGDGALTAC